MPEGPGAERLRAAGVPVEVVPLGRIRAGQVSQLAGPDGRSSATRRSRLSQAISPRQPDVVQLNGLINPHAALVARAMGIPLVWQLRHPSAIEGPQSVRTTS